VESFEGHTIEATEIMPGGLESPGLRDSLKNFASCGGVDVSVDGEHLMANHAHQQAISRVVLCAERSRNGDMGHQRDKRADLAQSSGPGQSASVGGTSTLGSLSLPVKQPVRLRRQSGGF
jgi:hypothetical protein